MVLFLTDSVRKYHNSKEKHRLLLNGIIIVKSTVHTENEILNFNNNNNGIEMEAGETMLAELYSLCDKLKNQKITANKFISAIPDQTEKLFALLFRTFSEEIIKKHMLKLFIERYVHAFDLDAISLIHLDFSDYRFSYFAGTLTDLFSRKRFIRLTGKGGKDAAKLLLRKCKSLFFYAPYYIARKAWNLSNVKKQPGNKHVLLIIDNIDHHFQVLDSFFKIISLHNEVLLSVVIFPTNLNQTRKNTWKHLQKRNIKFYFFSEFRKPLFRDYNSRFIRDIADIHSDYKLPEFKSNLNDMDIAYESMDNLFTTLKPDSCLHMSTHETGRIMTNVASYYKTPSVQADYALFSDWYALESRIRFTARASINLALIDLWKKRKDPTPLHYAIGFCKLDQLKAPEITRADFHRSHKLNPVQLTVLFASTWNIEGQIHELEKIQILSKLSDVCHNNNWNFIVKKHPLEKDNLAADIISKNKHPNQKVFSHADLKLEEAIFYADLVTNQNSSIVLECLYYEKPFCYITTSTAFNQTENSIFKKEAFASTLKLEDFEQFALGMLQSDSGIAMQQLMRAKKEYYLYKTDGKASERLFQLLLQLMNSDASGKSIF